MISLKVIGKGYLKMFPDTQVQLNENSPVFSESGLIPPTYSIPFDVPDDDGGHNATILGAANVVESTDRTVNKELPAILFFDGAPDRYGVIQTVPASGRVFSITFLSGIRSLAEDFKTLKLKNLPWTSVTLHNISFGTDDNAEVADEATMQQSNVQALAAINTEMSGNRLNFHRINNPDFVNEKLSFDHFRGNVGLTPILDGYLGVVNQLDDFTRPRANGKIISKAYRWTTGLTYDSEFSNTPDYNGVISLIFQGVTYSSGSGKTALVVKYRELISSIETAYSSLSLFISITTDTILYNNERNGDLLNINLYTTIDTPEFDINVYNPTQSYPLGAHVKEGIPERYYRSNQSVSVSQSPTTNPEKWDDVTDELHFGGIDFPSGWLEHEPERKTQYSNRYFYSPTFFLVEIFDQISNHYDIAFKGDFFQDSALEKIIYYGNKSLMREIEITDQPDRENTYGFNSEYHPGEYMPDWTVAEFIKEVALLTNSLIDYNVPGRVITFRYKRDIINQSSYKDARSEGITHSPNPVIGGDNPSGYTLRFAQDNTELSSLFTNQFERKIGNGEAEIVSNFTSLDTQFTELSIASTDSVAPFIKEEEGLLKNPVILFDRGIENANQRADYQTADFTYKLRWTDAIGTADLYSQFWEEWIRFLIRRKSVTFTMRWYFRHLNQHKWESKYLIDRNKYLIKSIKTTKTTRGISTARVEAYTTG